MPFTIKEIREEMGGRLAGNKFMQLRVARAISLLPENIAEKIIKDCWFFSSFDESFGFAFNGNDLENQQLIFLSDALFRESEHQILFTILHEIGHISLGHKNSIQYTQTKAEIKKQEKEADEFAQYYLN